MRSVVIASFVVAMAGTAAAEPAAGPVIPAPSPPEAASLAPSPPPAQPAPSASAQPLTGELSEGAALSLSLGGTLVSWGVLLAAASVDHGSNAAVPLAAIGTVLAPSFGHWYAGSPMSRGFGVRLLGLGVLVVSAVDGFQCSEDCRPRPVLEGALVVGLGLYLAGTLDDVATAPGAARSQNQRRHSVVLVPMVRRDSGSLVVMTRF